MSLPFVYLQCFKFLYLIEDIYIFFLIISWDVFVIFYLN